MGSIELPSRAKPEALHTLCRYIRAVSGSEKVELYDELDLDQRQIRASIDYGAKLGFLTADDGYVQNTERGSGISYSESVDDKPVQTAFREAIEFYDPYRETLLRIHAQEMVEEVNGKPAIKQSSFQHEAESATGEERSGREINLMIKTAQAAGLGEFITGRKGFETRLVISDAYREYIEELAEEYPAPEPMDADDENMDDGRVSRGEFALDVDGMTLKASESANELKLQVEYDVTDRSDSQIADLVRQIRGSE